MSAYAWIAFALVIFPSLCLTITVLGAHIDHRYMEPDRQRLLHEQRKEDCRYCAGVKGWNAIRVCGPYAYWHPRIVPHPMLPPTSAPELCEAAPETPIEINWPRRASAQEAFRSLGDSFAQLGAKILMERDIGAFKHVTYADEPILTVFDARREAMQTNLELRRQQDETLLNAARVLASTGVSSADAIGNVSALAKSFGEATKEPIPDDAPTDGFTTGCAKVDRAWRPVWEKHS